MPDHKFFIKSSKTDTLTKEDIPALEDDWIVIKSKLNQKDQEDMQQHQIEIEMTVSTRSEARRMQRDGQSPMRTSYRSATSFLLSLAIVDWSFIDDETNSKIPINLDSIHQLDPRLAEAINEEIDERNPMSWENDPKKDLLSTGNHSKVGLLSSQNARSDT